MAAAAAATAAAAVVVTAVAATTGATTTLTKSGEGETLSSCVSPSHTLLTSFQFIPVKTFCLYLYDCLTFFGSHIESCAKIQNNVHCVYVIRFASVSLAPRIHRHSNVRSCTRIRRRQRKQEAKKREENIC